MPNNLVSRIMEDPKAENEADRLSRGVTASTQNEVMREMGSRLGADLSDVKFHIDSLNMKRSQAMGAKGWARGRDVYFGKDGFDPKVAAHELVHTVQQGAVKGDTSVSMPYGAVQLDENDDNIIRTDQEQENQRQRNQRQKGDEPAIRELDSKLIKLFGTEEGVKVYMAFNEKIRDLLNARLNRKNIRYSAKGTLRLLVRACYRDYALRKRKICFTSPPVIITGHTKWGMLWPLFWSKATANGQRCSEIPLTSSA